MQKFQYNKQHKSQIISIRFTMDLKSLLQNVSFFRMSLKQYLKASTGMLFVWWAPRDFRRSKFIRYKITQIKCYSFKFGRFMDF